MADQMIPTLAMTRDPRLRRLFALVGRAYAEEVEGWGLEPETLDALFYTLMDLAPEFLPPEFGPDADETLLAEWESMVEEATSGGTQ